MLNEKPLFDKKGYRASVGIVLVNENRQLFWAKRAGHEGWQFPQGGIGEGEDTLQALYRELEEEIGLSKGNVKLLGCTKKWLSYKFPEYLKRKDPHLEFIGQKQKWFLLQLIADDKVIRLDNCSDPEFDQWRWVSYWYPLRYVIDFKKTVYRHLLKEFLQLDFFKNG